MAMSNSREPSVAELRRDADRTRAHLTGTVEELRGMAGSPNEELTPVFLKLTGGSGLQEIEEIV